MLSFGQAPYKIGEEIRGRLLKISYVTPKQNWSKGTYTTLPYKTSRTMAVAIRNSFFLCYVLFQFWAMLNHYALVYYQNIHCFIIHIIAL
jgi:hypothetical protein